MITSYLVVFGALSQMVKVRGAYGKPFWIISTIVTREESWEATAEWVMFYTAFSDIGDLPSANLFRFQHSMQSFGEGYMFQILTWSLEAFSWRPT